MTKLPSLNEGANRAEETAPWLASRDTHKGPAGQGRLWTASHGAVSAASRAAPPFLTRLVDSLPGRRRGSARLHFHSPESKRLHSPEKKGGGPSSYPGPRVPRAASAHPESPPRGRAPKGPSGGHAVLSVRSAIASVEPGFNGKSACLQATSLTPARAAERLSPTEPVDRAGRTAEKECPGRVCRSPGLVVPYRPNLTDWPMVVNSAAQPRGVRSFSMVAAPRKGACSPR